MNGPSRFEISDEQVKRNAHGIAACRAVLDPILARRDRPEPEKPLTPSEEIHQRALERATAEKRAKRIPGLEPIGSVLHRALPPRRSA